MYGIYYIDKKQLHIESKEFSYFENNRYIVCYDGHIKHGVDKLLFEKDNCFDWRDMFTDVFLLFRFDKQTGRLLITQHLFGNGKNLYFVKNSEKFIIASTLAEIKKLANIPFELNIAMLPHYFYNGFLPSSHTLIDGVRKLEAGVFLLIDGSDIRKNSISFHSRNTYLEETDLEIRYRNELRNSIVNVASDIEEPFSIALSGGYDSNCILFSIKEQWSSKHIKAFSIGGSNGTDETKIAAQIAKMYRSVDFYSSFVNSDTLEKLDEIVCILEGSVYERGIFLQYELSQLLKSHSVKKLICGECTDQVFHQNTYKQIPEDAFLYGYLDTPCQMASYVVLKKNRLMMDAFGINTRYPFLSAGMIDIGYETRSINGTTKEFHKAQCRSFLPGEVLALISKQGGSTNLQSLISENVGQLLERRKYYSRDFRLTGKYDKDEAIRDYYLSLLYIESFEKQFCDR